MVAGKLHRYILFSCLTNRVRSTRFVSAPYKALKCFLPLSAKDLWRISPVLSTGPSLTSFSERQGRKYEETISKDNS
jgi:hypothetical protein